MPYITKEQRYYINNNSLNELLDDISNEEIIENPGELNYTISSIVDTYLQKKGKNYTNLNEVIGVLECVKQEYYRRVVSPYEDLKKEENGDIFEL